MLTKPPVPYDFYVSVPISCLDLRFAGLAFNQEKALIGAFSMIVKLRRLIFCISTDDRYLQGGHSNSINTRRLPPPVAGPGPGYADSPPPHPDRRQLGPGHFSPPPPELPKHLSRGPSREHIPEQMKNKIEVCHIYHFYNISRNRLSESEYPFNSHGDIEEDSFMY